MTLKNSDGTEYKLNGPNPLGMTQSQIKEEIILHNLDGHAVEKIINNDKETPVMIMKNSMVKEPQQDPMPETMPETVKVIENVVKKHTNVISIHCLPVELKVIEDELYGDKYSKIKYGNKFTFEGVVVDSQDFKIKIWSEATLTEKSVIYPSHYVDSGQKFGDFRWWKINKSEPAQVGFFYEAVVSDYQPDFSPSIAQ